MTSTLRRDLTVFEEDALALTQAALEIARAFEIRDEVRLVAALDRNRHIWTGLAALLARPDTSLPTGIKDIAPRLSDIMIRFGDATATTVKAIIRANLELATDLFEWPEPT